MDDPVQRVHGLIDRELPRRHSNRVMHATPIADALAEADVPHVEEAPASKKA
jgi:hypothetical protein